MSTPLHLILLAGGQGLRAGGSDGIPKQFRQTERGALFAVSLREFQEPVAGARWHLASVTVTVAERWHEQVTPELAACSVPWYLAEPGETRTASTWSALQALGKGGAPEAADLVAVHDSARPFATVQLLDTLSEAALRSGGAIPGVPVPDTIVQATGGPANYLQRDSLLAVQTPQVFQWDALRAAHDWAHDKGLAFTDDGGLLAARGHSPVVVPGEAGNWKVTTAADWERAKNILA